MIILNNIISFFNSLTNSSNNLYWGCYILGFLTIFVFNTFYAKKFDINKGKAFVLTVLSYILILVWAYVLAWAESLFTNWGHHNAVRVYIWMPALLYVLAKPMSIEWKKACDFIAPSTCIVYGIARLGCLFPGCCYGIPCEWGIYSDCTGYEVFPVQLCEAITSLVIAFFAIYMNRKKEYIADSKTYFIMLIPYGISRFIWEFFADNEKVFLNISSLALHALLMSVVGIVMLIILNKMEKKKKIIP
ncbi:MAG: prolipoprotein diacylglyceryl transferase [Oscillospiraceae bacterium]|nr:prolipoprotein diacylglyceryl transferase [Oscillospiraceae bacterium]